MENGDTRPECLQDSERSLHETVVLRGGETVMTLSHSSPGRHADREADAETKRDVGECVFSVTTVCTVETGLSPRCLSIYCT